MTHIYISLFTRTLSIGDAEIHVILQARCSCWHDYTCITKATFVIYIWQAYYCFIGQY